MGGGSSGRTKYVEDVKIVERVPLTLNVVKYVIYRYNLNSITGITDYT